MSNFQSFAGRQFGPMDNLDLRDIAQGSKDFASLGKQLEAAARKGNFRDIETAIMRLDNVLNAIKAGFRDAKKRQK